MFKGSMPALVTPFKNGELDIDTLKQLVEWHIGEGSHGFVPVGTTGESPTLTHTEHDKVVEVVVKAAFAQRRKTLRNTLKTLINSEQLHDIGVDPASRAETLSLSQFIDIANSVHRLQS
mgnify:CR=1 FL=1